MARTWVVGVVSSAATIALAGALVGAYALGRSSGGTSAGGPANEQPVATAVPASASAASTSISGPSAADYAKQACTASEAPNRYAIANHTSPPPSALSDALKEATALAAKAAQIDAGWKDLLDAFDQWYTDTFLGQAVDNAKLQPVLHTVTVECLRSGYQYGS